MGMSEVFLFSKLCHVAATRERYGTRVIAAGLVACMAAAAGHAGNLPETTHATVVRRGFAMGTRLEVNVEAADRHRAIAASQAALDAVDDTERRLSTWRDDSELVRLNAAPVGRWVPLSVTTARQLSEAVTWANTTGGAFDPTVGALVRAWDLRGAGRVPRADELRAVCRTVGPAGLEVGPHAGRRTVDGVVVEEGGFGKGAALRAATEAAVSAGARCVRVDLGGQWASAGACDEMQMSIAHPTDRGRVVATFSWTGGSVATSGHSERRVTSNDIAIGHLLDPRTGRPAPDRGSVTVLTADSLAADAIATALAVMGPEEGSRWLDGRPELPLEAVFAFTLPDGGVRLLATPGVVDRVSAQPGVTLRRLGGEIATHRLPRGGPISDPRTDPTTPDDEPA